MNIGFDIQSTLGKITGIPRYALNLLNAFSKLKQAPVITSFHSNIHRDLRTYERFWWEAIELPKQYLKSKTELLHVPGFGVRKTKARKVILTAHDIIGYLFPQNVSPTARLYWSKWLPWCFQKADHLIVDAYHTREDLVRHLKIPEKKISVIYLDADPGCQAVPPAEAKQKLARELGVADPYFLFVGTIEPRKNLVRTLKAYARARKQKPDLPKLLVVGAKEWGREPFEQALRELELARYVIATGYVSDEMLWNMYSASYAVIFVSLYEGFGLPLVEALRCGVPVIASNNSSLGEIGKDAAYLVDPYSEEEISQAILEIARSSTLARELVEGGKKKSSMFSWRKTAEETLKAYKAVLSAEC